MTQKERKGITDEELNKAISYFQLWFSPYDEYPTSVPGKPKYCTGHVAYRKRDPKAFSSMRRAGLIYEMDGWYCFSPSGRNLLQLSKI